MRTKGLRQIKTLSSKHKSPARTDLKKISSLTMIRRSEFRKQQQSYSPKTWVFIAEPKFSRCRQNLLIERSKEPETELFIEAEAVVVIAEITGVANREDVTLTAEGDILILEAVTQARKYYKEIVIPFNIDETAMYFSLNNGLIEITLFPKNRGKK